MDNPQKLNVNLSIEIPPEYVLITKVEFEELINRQLIGRWWTMQDLEEHTNMKRDWLKEKILYIPKFKGQLEKFVSYPERQGEKWSFQATKMTQFLEDNFYSIFKKK